jgi:c-di-GMP-binding flagellar brake protein YcgR
MFHSGQILKAKVEIGPGTEGFGKVQILKTDSKRIYLQFKTSKNEAQILPVGSKLWITTESKDSPFLGVWFATVVGSRVVENKTALEVTNPKFTKAPQRRMHERLTFECPVELSGHNLGEISSIVQSRNISRSGLGLEVDSAISDVLTVGDTIDVKVLSTPEELKAVAKVIRSQYNMLSTKTLVGLEFVEIDETNKQALNSLLEELQSKQNTDSNADSGLSSWVKSERGDSSFLKGNKPQ